MIKYLALLTVLLFATAAFPQTANVIQLDPDDATRVKDAYDALQRAQATYDAVRTQLGERYTADAKSCERKYGINLVMSGTCSKEGFENGFEFSKDFRFIVPKPTPPTTGQGTITTAPWGSGSFTCTLPAIGGSCGPYSYGVIAPSYPGFTYQ